MTMRSVVAFSLAVILAVGAPSSARPSPAWPAWPAGPVRESAVRRLVVPAAAHRLPGDWHQAFVVHYGPRPRQLGTAPGGDSGTLDVGPDYGAPARDGSWWFLDAAKKRLAHYAATGRYLGRVRIPRRLLVSGKYFQWQLPHVLDDGTLVAAQQAADGTHLLRLRHGRVDEIALHATLAPTYDDGRLVYGFGGSGSRIVAVDPATGAVTHPQAFRLRSGRRFSLELGSSLRFTLRGVSRRLPLRTASGAVAHVGAQVRAAANGRLYLYLTGLGEDDESVDLVGATMIDRRERVSRVEALPSPFSEADPGSPAQLAMAPGSSTPMLVYVLDDGVHVYEQAAS